MAKKLVMAAVSLLLVGGIGVVLSADESTIEVASAPVSEELWGAATMFSSDDVIPEARQKPVQLASGDDSFRELQLTLTSPTAKDRLIKAASAFADCAEEAEIQKLAEELESKNIEASARMRLRDAELELQKLVNEHPNTAAGKRAAQMLSVPVQ